MNQKKPQCPDIKKIKFIEPGTEVNIACRVQDDLGGEGMKAMKLKVE